MKKIYITLIILLLNVLAFSQTTDSIIKGVIGVKFGMRQSQVKSIILSKGGTLEKTTSQDYGISLSYKNLSFLSNKANLTHFKFYKDSLFGISFCFIVDANGFTQAKYDALKEKIETKYGDGKCTRSFVDPYYDGDGYEMSAVDQGKATISCLWADIYEHTIELSIKISLMVVIEYQYEKLVAEAIKDVESKQMKDY